MILKMEHTEIPPKLKKQESTLKKRLKRPPCYILQIIPDQSWHGQLQPIRTTIMLSHCLFYLSCWNSTYSTLIEMRNVYMKALIKLKKRLYSLGLDSIFWLFIFFQFMLELILLRGKWEIKCCSQLIIKIWDII